MLHCILLKLFVEEVEMKSRTWVHKLILSGIMILTTVIGSFGDELKNQQAVEKKSELKGTIRISGAWALYPMMVKWGEEFQKINPAVRVDISAGGAGKGVADALGGLVDIGMVSREIRPEEIAKGGFFVPVVKDAVFPVVNQSNPLVSRGLEEKGIKKQAFIDLWITGKALTWGEILGVDIKDKVAVYTRSDACGAAETWAKYLGKNQEDLLGVGVYGDPGLAEAVKKDALGIGFNNLNYAYDVKTGLPVAGLQVVYIDVNENGIIDPQEDLSSKQKAIEAVATGMYPSPPARDLFLLAKGEFSGLSNEIVRWILTDGQKFIDETGYIQLSPQQIADALAKLEQ
jgi:phosphate transport system substrate-binding protein